MAAPRRYPNPDPQSELLVLVPEAEDLVAPFRLSYDPAAAAGVPAHITVLFPFQNPSEIDHPSIDRLKACCRSFEPFDYKLVGSGRFPGLIYLVPSPDDRFIALTRSIWAAFPEHPPYEGKYPDIVPHLTVASGLDESGVERIAREIGAKADRFLPITSRATTLTLMDNIQGPWAVVDQFDLGR